VPVVKGVRLQENKDLRSSPAKDISRREFVHMAVRMAGAGFVSYLLSPASMFADTSLNSKVDEWLKMIENTSRPQAERVKAFHELDTLLDKNSKSPEMYVLTLNKDIDFRFKNSRSVITSGGLGTMGFCLPASMGAQIGAPDRTVVAVIGDGGFQMTIQELLKQLLI